MAKRFVAKKTGVVHAVKRARKRSEIVSACDWYYHDVSIDTTEQPVTCLWCIVEAEN